MDELNNKQVVLLTMFVSFVVSIATGIITVAMLQEAPPTLTQTVNRIVEHTIERVSTGTTTESVKPQPIVTNVTKEVTVYAREDDLVVSAVQKNTPRMVKVYTSGVSTSSSPRAIGFVVSRDGIIVANTKKIVSDGSLDKSYSVVIGDTPYEATPISSLVKDNAVSFLKITNLSTTTPLDAVSFGKSENPKLAQTVMVLGGSDGGGVFRTALSKFRYSSNGTSTSPSITGIETIPSIPDRNEGGLVINLDGQVVGEVIPDPNDSSQFVVFPVSNILSALNESMSASL